MRNLLGFLSRNLFFIFFLLLEVIAIFLLIQNNRYQQSRFLNSSNFVTGRVYQSENNATKYLNLDIINEDLATENAKLKAELANSKIQIFGNNYIINDTIYHQQFEYSETRVINNSVTKANNYITLDKGSFNGIKEGMGVIGPKGVVGIVKTVSPHFSSVLTVLHSQSKISAKLKSQNYYGSMIWDGKDYQYGKLINIPKHVKLFLGDTIVSSGFSAIFPKGIDLATITGIEKPSGNNFYDIDIKFINDFKNLEQVYVVKNVLKEEQLLLEQTTQEGDSDD